MKRLGLTAVSASALVEATQQLEARESTTTPTEEAYRVESSEFKQNLMPDPLQVFNLMTSGPCPGPLQSVVKLCSNVNQLIAHFCFVF
jgi:hypothetical protein